MNKEKIYLFIIIILTLVIIVGCALQAQTSKTLSVTKIIVPKDGLEFQTTDGKTLLKVYKGEYDGGMLDIYNNQEKRIVEIGTSLSGGGLCISDNQGLTVAGMSATDSGGWLVLFGNNGKLFWSKP
jgi:hypothetical protein